MFRDMIAIEAQAIVELRYRQTLRIEGRSVVRAAIHMIEDADLKRLCHAV